MISKILPERPKGRQTKDRLVEACLERLWVAGYAASSIADIADAAAAPRGSVFYHFASKDDLVVAAVEEYVTRATARRRLELWSKRKRGEGALECLQRYFRGRIAFRRQHQFARGCLLGNLAGEVDPKASPRVAAAVNDGLAVFERDLLDYLNEAGSAGDLNAVDGFARVATALVNGWEGALLRMKMQRSGAALEAFVASFPILLRRTPS